MKVMVSQKKLFGDGRKFGRLGIARAWRSYKEYAFLLLIAVLCIAISCLQFKWTGRLADAEKKTALDNQEMSAIAFCAAFDHELSTASKELLSMLEDSKEGAVTTPPRNWSGSEHRHLFQRIAIGEFDQDLKMIDSKTGLMARVEWPAEWRSLNAHLAEPPWVPGGPPQPPLEWDGEGTLLIFPFWRDRNATPVSEIDDSQAWRPQLLILELDQKNLREIWLPSLVKRFLDPSGQQSSDVRILTKSGRPIFSQHLAGALGNKVVVEFNRQGRSTELGRGPRSEAVWKLEVRKKSGDLERLVTESRVRNLFAAGAVNCLILVSGFALAKHSRKARILGEEQMNFVASVSHELRTPVTVILGAAHNLERGITSEAQDVMMYGGMIRRQATQLSKMVQQVLEFSSFKNGEMLDRRSLIDIAQVVSSALEDSEADIAGMTVDRSIEPTDHRVRGDPEALQRAVGNLIRNAAKHAASGGWIGIRVENKDDRLYIEVADRGPGIPKSEQHEIFKAFFRGERARENHVRGSGIGLGLVKEIIEFHGGEISVRSELGKGSTFIIMLPVS